MRLKRKKITPNQLRKGVRCFLDNASYRTDKILLISLLFLPYQDGLN
jgi:hypothetical protein